MRRDLPIFLAFLGALTLLLLVPGGSEDPGEPATGAAAVASIERFELDPAGGLPRWRAERTVPSEGGSVLVISGRVVGLELGGVEVELGGGLVLQAARGEYRPDRLALSTSVRVERSGHRLLISAAASIEDGTVHFPGIVVLSPGGARERTLRERSFPIGELRAAIDPR